MKIDFYLTNATNFCWHTLESYLGRFIGIGSITEINLQDTNKEQNDIKRYNNNGNR